MAKTQRREERKIKTTTFKYKIDNVRKREEKVFYFVIVNKKN